jgi:intein/homing endonuclease
MKNSAPSILVHPLVDNQFNQAKCLVGDTLIITENGIKNIQSLALQENKIKIWQKKSFKPISNFFKYEQKQVREIITSCGYKICGTLNHKIMSDGNFKQISELKIGDKIELSFFDFPDIEYKEIPCYTFKSFNTDRVDKSKINKDLIPKLKINERWGRFLGYLLGDGYIGGGNRVSISCDSKYTDIVDDIKLFASEIGVTCGASIKKINGKDGNGVDLHLSSKILKVLIADSLGFQGVNGKILKVPNVIMNSPKSVIKEFIRGVFETDGTVEDCGCSFTTKKLKLAEEIQFLLLGFKIKSKISKYFNKNYRKYYYSLNLGREASDIFYKEINFISEEKQKKLKNIITKKHSNAFKEWEMEDQIVGISDRIDDVFDIEIPDGHCYNANGFMSHNSNIAWIEATYAGAIAVVPEFPEYSKQGTVTYKDEKEFSFFMETYMNNESARENLFQESKKYITDNLLLSNINKKRIGIIDFLFSDKIKKPNLKIVQ